VSSPGLVVFCFCLQVLAVVREHGGWCWLVLAGAGSPSFIVIPHHCSMVVLCLSKVGWDKWGGTYHGIIVVVGSLLLFVHRHGHLFIVVIILAPLLVATSQTAMWSLLLV